MAVLAPPVRPAGAAGPAGPDRRGPRAALLRLLASPPRVLLVAALLAAFAACVDVLHDPDLWWHLRLGRWILDNHTVPHAEMFSFTAAGNTMVAHEWGSEVLFTLLSGVGGLLLVAAVMGLVAWSGLVALALRVRARGASAAAVAVAVLLGARAAEPVLGTRPQVITVALVCWTLLLCERHLVRGGRWIWALPPIVLVWANLHGGVVLGLGSLALFVALEALRIVLRRPGAASWDRLRAVAVSLALAALAGCLNPDGPGLYRYSLATSGSERLKPITEWHSPNFADPSNLGLLVLLVSFAALVALGGRLNLRDLGMSLAGFAAALIAVRNTSLAVALALPAWTLMLQQVVTRLRLRRHARPTEESLSEAPASEVPEPGEVPARRSPSRTDGSPRIGAQFLGLSAAIIALAAAAPIVTITRAAADSSAAGIASTYPSCAASALQGLPGVTLLAPYYDSGYLIDQLWPSTHVFIYGESASLGMQVFDDYQRIEAGAPDALALLSAHGTNAVLTAPGALKQQLEQSPAWHAVVTDPTGLTLYAATGSSPLQAHARCGCCRTPRSH
ncbi:MAG TPA: hypothetical protein VFC09_05010 [Candidatus Dormibacteraeota bacterium]|nr:hypothetical protein [Candidatus Dormibacteraeota bacterium]